MFVISPWNTVVMLLKSLHKYIINCVVEGTVSSCKHLLHIIISPWTAIYCNATEIITGEVLKLLKCTMAQLEGQFLHAHIYSPLQMKKGTNVQNLRIRQSTNLMIFIVCTCTQHGKTAETGLQKQG